MFKEVDTVFEKIDELFDDMSKMFSNLIKEPRLVVDRYRITHNPNVKVEDRGFEQWAVVNYSDKLKGHVLNKDGKWEWEPQPSQRKPEFVIRTRFKSAEEAFEAFSKTIKK